MPASTVPTTMDEFFAACEKIKAAGKICLSLGPQWTAMHLFENVMIGTLGAEKWSALWTAGADWASADVTTALDNYAKALSYTNTDHAAPDRLAARHQAGDRWRCRLQHHGRLGRRLPREPAPRTAWA